MSELIWAISGVGVTSTLVLRTRTPGSYLAYSVGELPRVSCGKCRGDLTAQPRPKVQEPN